MRNKFGKWITEKAKSDDKILLLVGDIGFGIFDDFRKEHPKKFINCGIAEQNMIGVAAGLAAKGYKPFVYTIIPFLVYRPFEFIRNLIFHQNLPVRLVGVGGGFSYDKLGYTHYAKEDINLIQNLSNNYIYSPYSPKNAQTCFEQSMKRQGPSYIRLMKGGEQEVTPIKKNKNYDIIKNYGDDFCIITHGSIITNAVEACDYLFLNKKVKGTVFGVFSNKLDSNLLLKIKKYKKILLYEESLYPGLLVNYSKELINLKIKVNLFYISNQKIINFNNREKILKNLNLSKKTLVNKILYG